VCQWHIFRFPSVESVSERPQRPRPGGIVENAKSEGNKKEGGVATP
jgi:hypothetical protein